MRRNKKDRTGPRLQTFELSEKNKKARWILVVVLLAVAVVAIVIGLFALLNTDPGWQIVEPASTQLNSGADFVLNYYFGEAGMSASAEKKALTTLYSTAVEETWLIFEKDVTDSARGNIYLVNSHVNETVTVDPALYQAFALIQQYGSRSLYLAPVYEEYNRIFRSESKEEAAEWDPTQNEELMPYLREVAAFANDPEAVELQLLDNNQVCLKVSEAYLAYARENGIETFLDFGWMKNAFIVDYLAQKLIDGGYTHGYLASFDGYTRNLDSRANTTYSFNLFDREGENVHLPAVMQYDQPLSIVYLRNYPMSDQDLQRYCAFDNGHVVHTIIDPADGANKTAADNLVGYGINMSCARILLEMEPVYVTDTLSEDALRSLTAKGIQSVWFDGTVLKHTQQDLRLIMQEGTAYTSQHG